MKKYKNKNKTKKTELYKEKSSHRRKTSAKPLSALQPPKNNVKQTE